MGRNDVSGGRRNAAATPPDAASRYPARGRPWADLPHPWVSAGLGTRDKRPDHSPTTLMWTVDNTTCGHLPKS